MRQSDILWLSYKDLREKKVRTALTVLMVVIGVAAIVALTSQVSGIGASIQQSLQSLGPTTIIISSSGSSGFTVADTSLLSSLPNVSSVTPLITGTVNVYSGSQNSSATLVGISSEGLQQLLGSVNLYQGQMFTDSVSPSAVLGYTIAFPTSLAGKESAFVGQPVTVKISGRNGATLTLPVVGILQQYGTTSIPVDTGVVVSLQAAEVMLHRSSYSTIIVKATNTSSVTALSTEISDIYGSRARVLTTQQLLETASSIIGSLSLLLGVIAGISLLVAAIGIMNIMLIAVYERTHEIGIMKSVGFKNRNILSIFLFQAVLIGVIGGLLGVLIGAGGSFGLSFLFSHASTASSGTTTTTSSGGFGGGGGFSGGGGSGFRGGSGGSSGATFVGAGGGVGSTSSSSLSYQPVVTAQTVISALLVAIIVSITAGIYPAWRASRMEPIDALRQL